MLPHLGMVAEAGEEQEEHDGAQPLFQGIPCPAGLGSVAVAKKENLIPRTGPFYRSVREGFIFSFIYFYLLSFVFSGPLLRHMEVPRLGVELEL